VIGLESLVRRLLDATDEGLVLWLETGLRTVARNDSGEFPALAFSPLILSRSAPELEQFHAAVEAMPGPLQARLRAACGWLVNSCRVQDDAGYLRLLWSLASAFKPPMGILSAARAFLRTLHLGEPLDERRRGILDRIVAAVLSYPRSEAQGDFLEEIRVRGWWSASHTEQYVLFLIKDSPRHWTEVAKEFNEELRALSGRPGFFRRFARAVGPAHLAKGISILNPAEGLDWFWRELRPFYHLQLMGGRVRATIAGESRLVDGDDMPPLETNDQIYAMLRSLDSGLDAGPDQAHRRLQETVSSGRADIVFTIMSGLRS
jgi:hypothetical protein